MKYRHTISFFLVFFMISFLGYGVDREISSKEGNEKEHETKKELKNPPCIAYLSTRTGTLQPTGTILANNLSFFSNDLFLWNSNSKQEINLTNNPDFFPKKQAWSPDGKILAWIYKQRQNLGIEVFEKGQKSILIPASEHFVESFAWSPRSDQIAFVGCIIKNRKRTNHGIYILKISDKSISKIFDVKSNEIFSPLYWVNNSLLWCNIIKGTVEKLDILDSQPQGSPQIIFNRENARCSKIAVSPDNNALAGIVNKQNRHSIWIFDLDGKNPHKLVDGESFDEYSAAWHPTDSKLLALSSRDPGKQSRLALYNFNTSKIIYIDLKDNYRYIDGITGGISWSKDGRYITVGCERSDVRNNSSDILIYDIENSEWINITDSKDSRDFDPVCRP